MKSLGEATTPPTGLHQCPLKIANGYHGWSEHAPFDKMIVTVAPDLIPPPLIQQLKAGGKLVIPAGLPDAQTLILVEKPGNGGVYDQRNSAGTVFTTEAA